MKKMKPLPACANGCGVPPDPPSLVICRKCQDRISEQLQSIAERMSAREKENPR